MIQKIRYFLKEDFHLFSNRTNFHEWYFFPIADVSPGIASASPGSPLLSSTRDLENSAERGRTIGRETEPTTEPSAEGQLHDFDLAPLEPGTVVLGEAPQLPFIEVDVLTPRRIIREEAAKLNKSVADENVLDGDVHSQNLLDGVGKN